MADLELTVPAGTGRHIAAESAELHTSSGVVLDVDAETVTQVARALEQGRRVVITESKE